MWNGVCKEDPLWDCSRDCTWPFAPVQQQGKWTFNRKINNPQVCFETFVLKNQANFHEKIGN